MAGFTSPSSLPTPISTSNLNLFFLLMFLTDFGMITMVSVTSRLTGHRILSQGSSTTIDITIVDKKHLRTSEQHSSKFWNTMKSLGYTKTPLLLTLLKPTRATRFFYLVLIVFLN